MTWSVELQALTRRSLQQGAVTSGDEVYLKHIDGRFGALSLDDVLAGRLVVVDRRTGGESPFRDVEALIEDGWVVD